MLFLKVLISGEVLTESGREFQVSMTLTDQKLFLTSFFPLIFSTFRQPVTNLVDKAPSLASAGVNHVDRSTLSLPVMILNIWIRSPLFLLSSMVDMPMAASFSSYDFPFTLVTMPTALL